MSKHAKKFTVSLLVTIIFLGIMTLIGSYILDPFQIYHSSYFAKDRYLKNDRYQNAGLINRLHREQQCCDTLIIGTSHSQNFLPNHLRDTFKIKGALDLTMLGARAIEQSILLQKILPSHNIKNIIWGLHITYSDSELFEINNDDLLKSSPDKFFPIYLYDDNVINDLQYLGSIDTYFNAIELYKNGAKYNRLKSWYNQNLESFNKGDVIKNLHPETILKKYNSKTGEPLEFPNIDKVIIQYVEKYPEIKFYFFFPPYSKHYYANIDEELYTKLMSMRLYIAQKLSPFKNVNMYAFDNIFDGTYDLNRYKDMAHYDEDMSKKIITYMSHNNGNLDINNVNDHIQKHTSNVNFYIEHLQSSKPKK